LRVRLAADYERLKFLRVLRHHGHETVSDTAQVITPAPPVAEGTLP
jgi:rod shape-determining protein MreC